MFVEEEGSWWWTSYSDERGSSRWAAGAQERLVEPLLEGFTWGEASDEFRLLSDEELIPPYYRTRRGMTCLFLALLSRETLWKLPASFGMEYILVTCDGLAKSLDIHAPSGV